MADFKGKVCKVEYPDINIGTDVQNKKANDLIRYHSDMLDTIVERIIAIKTEVTPDYVDKTLDALAACSREAHAAYVSKLIAVLLGCLNPHKS